MNHPNKQAMMNASIVTQSTRSPLKKKVHQTLLEDDDHQPQYFSDAISVLKNQQPGGGGRGKAYYVVYTPVLSKLDEDDVLLAYSPSSMIDDEDDINVQGFVTQVAETCVACTLPVIHFIQFFMC